MHTAILKHETTHNLAPVVCAELLTAPTPAKCNSNYVTQAQYTTDKAYLNILLKITHSLAINKFATLLNARALFALMFVWKQVLGGKTNPSNTKALATSPQLTSVLLSGFFRFKPFQLFGFFSHLGYFIWFQVIAVSLHLTDFNDTPL